MADVFVGIGSSINRRENVQTGIASLASVFSSLQVSPIYESEAVGFKGGNFYNLAVRFSTDLSIENVIKQLKQIEIEHGRPEFAIKYAPRTLDLDLLLYDQEVLTDLDLPRAEITENAFVLKPLSDLAPELTHPILGDSYQSLWDNYPKDKQKIWQVEASL